MSDILAGAYTHAHFCGADELMTLFCFSCNKFLSYALSKTKFENSGTMPFPKL